MSEVAVRLYFETYFFGWLFSFFLHSSSEKKWKTTVELPRGIPVQYRYFKGYFLEPKVCTTLSTLSWLILRKNSHTWNKKRISWVKHEIFFRNKSWIATCETLKHLWKYSQFTSGNMWPYALNCNYILFFLVSVLVF